MVLHQTVYQAIPVMEPLPESVQENEGDLSGAAAVVGQLILASIDRLPLKRAGKIGDALSARVSDGILIAKDGLEQRHLRLFIKRNIFGREVSGPVSLFASDSPRRREMGVKSVQSLMEKSVNGI